MTARATFHGRTLDQARERATEAFNAFFENHAWRTVSEEASPCVSDSAGSVRLWAVDVCAEVIK